MFLLCLYSRKPVRVETAESKSAVSPDLISGLQAEGLLYALVSFIQPIIGASVPGSRENCCPYAFIDIVSSSFNPGHF